MSNSLVDLLDRLGRVYNLDYIGMPPGFGQEPFSDSSVISEVAAFHAIRRTRPPTKSDLDRQIQNQSQVGQQAAGGDPANLPKLVRVESAGVTLVDDVGQQVAVSHDASTGGEGGPNHLGRELRPASHE
jgi:hypothetical protein